MFSSSRFQERREGLKEFKYIKESRSDVFTIHYSCESFNSSKSSSPRVTSISLYNLSSGDQKSFSIHIEAQKKGYNSKKLSTEELNASERSLLQKFYKFVKAHQGCLWVHWCMKNSKYGFEALSDRYEILTRKSAPTIKVQERYDLYVLLRKLYGPTFESDEKRGKLLGLAYRNRIVKRGMLHGQEEAEAFSKRDFQSIMASSQNKAEVLGLLVEAVGEKRLKVQASIKEIYGISALGILLFIGDNFSRIWKIATAIGSLVTILVAL